MRNLCWKMRTRVMRTSEKTPHPREICSALSVGRGWRWGYFHGVYITIINLCVRVRGCVCVCVWEVLYYSLLLIGLHYMYYLFIIISIIDSYLVTEYSINTLNFLMSFIIWMVIFPTFYCFVVFMITKETIMSKNYTYHFFFFSL